ncbi:MAG TPA: glycosyltransferase family 4 protein [Anaerolineales bacterium]|nr:glycosyltransferase family 4 protein [Anaerolineales bacterium]
MKKLRICVVEMVNAGGLLHFDYQLCTAFAAAGADVTLVTGTEYELSHLPHNFKVHKILRLWKGFDRNPLGADAGVLERVIAKTFRAVRRVHRGVLAMFAWLRLTLYLLRVKPDITQFSKLEYFFEFIFIWFFKRMGLVVTQVCHEFEQREEGGGLSSLVRKLDIAAYRSFSSIFFLSEDGRKRFLGAFSLTKDNVAVVIPHGNSEWMLGLQSPSQELNLRGRYGLPVDTSVVLFFGLLSPSKGVEDLIEAFALVVKTTNARLVVAGYPTKFINAASLKAQVNRLGISGKVVLDLRYIPLNELGALMELAAVVVYPYHSSTQSGALQVAYTFGKPVIATRVGGLPEVVEDGKSGFLVPTRSPGELAQKIAILVGDRALADAMGKYARTLSLTRFNWDSIARKMLSVYETS